MFQAKVQNLRKNQNELRTMPFEMNSDFVFLQKTWMSKKECLTKFENHFMIQKRRETKRGE